MAEVADNSQNTNQKQPTTKNKLINDIFGYSLIIIVIIVLITCFSTCSNEQGSNKYMVKTYTEQSILKHYPLKYPDTFDLAQIQYYKTDHQEKQYELWKAQGYFTAENALGIKIKTNYIVYIQYKNDENKYYLISVYVKDSYWYGSYKKIQELL